MSRMRHLTILLALFLAYEASGQAFYFPVNHDSDNNGNIGVADLMSLLSLFGEDVGLESELSFPEYPFDDFEQMIYDMWDEELVLDSIYFHYRVEGLHSWYPAGVPELVTDSIIYEREVTMYPNNPHAYYPPGGSLHLIANLEGCQIRFWFTRTGNGGEYRINIADCTATSQYLQSIGFLSTEFPMDHTWHIEDGLDSSIWSMDDEGWHFNPGVWGNNSVLPFTVFECIPYWHSN